MASSILPGELTYAQKKKEYFRKWREGQRARGLCTGCVNKVAPGRTMCPSCLAKANARKRQERVVNGDVVRAKANCYYRNNKEHLWERANNRKRQWRANHKLKNLCVWCSNPTSIGCVYCKECLYRISHNPARKTTEYRNQSNERERARRLAWLKKGNCYRCGAPLSDEEKKYCFACMGGARTHQIKGVVHYAIAD